MSAVTKLNFEEASNLEKILYLGDNVNRYIKLDNTNVLTDDYKVHHCSTYVAAKKYLTKHSCKICIIENNEITLPQLESLFEQLQKKHLMPIPIILIKDKLDDPDNASFENNKHIIFLSKEINAQYLMGMLRGLTTHLDFLNTSISTTQKAWVVSRSIKCGEFEIKTLDEAQSLSIFLGTQFPNPKIASMGIFELVLNAIEHGHHEIGFDLKAKLVKENIWSNELKKRIERDKRDQVVKVLFNQDDEKLIVRVIDQGEGFNWKKYYNLDPAYAMRQIGRGIVFTKCYCFDGMQYNETGNQVTVYTKRKQTFKW